MTRALAGILLLLLPGAAFAQQASPSPTPAHREEEMTLEELLDQDTSVAARKATTVREAPGVITLVTRQEILESGARDLIDVLNLVPGFSFGVDVSNVVGTAFRGIWGHEGKVLWLLDGQTMNELMYSNDTLGDHIPVEQIERVEIVRGPGSAIYGGFAELAVINIVTQGARDLDGVRLAASGAQQTRGLGQIDGSAAWGKAFDNGMELSVALSGGHGQRSDRTYTDFNGVSFDMNRNSSLDPRMANLAFAWKGFRARAILDGYSVGSRDGYTDAYDRSYTTGFASAIADAQYDWSPTWGVTVTPRINFTEQQPWRVTVNDGTAPFYEKTVQRITASVSSSWDVRNTLSLLGGVEAYREHASLDAPSDPINETPLDGGTQVTHYDGAIWAQAILRTPFGDLLAGARGEDHSAVGRSFVPRAALTKRMGRAHVKLLAAEAFRAPSVENININESIEPERTTVFEAEAGYQLTDHVFVTANAFDITVRHPIVFAVVGSANDGYFNFGETGSTGGELEVQSRFPAGWITASLSYSSPRGKNDVPLYRVPGHADALLGVPKWKASFVASFALARGVTLAPSIVWIGPRFGYLDGDGSGTGRGVVGEEPAATIVNVFLGTSGVFLEGLDAGIGLRDALDSGFRYLQPYDGGHAPLPAASREITGRVAWHF